MMTRRHDESLTVTEAARRGVAGLITDAERGSPLVLTRRCRPVAVVVGSESLAALEKAVSDAGDLASALQRAADDAGGRTSLDEVLAAFGHTRESLAALPDDE
ncbi:type II toxin-antitoxin system prevent-host-death family antitoxin [Streptomyces mayteni]